MHESFDALAVHPYAAGVSGAIEQIGQVRRVAERSGDGRARIWLTELGWASRGRAASISSRGAMARRGS